MAILSYVHEIQTVYNVVQNPQMILLSEKGAHGVSSSVQASHRCSHALPHSGESRRRCQKGTVVIKSWSSLILAVCLPVAISHTLAVLSVDLPAGGEAVSIIDVCP